MEVKIKVKEAHKVKITERELQVIQLTSEDISSKEISVKLGISIKTVETHKYNILRKTGCRTIAGLLPILFRQGFLK